MTNFKITLRLMQFNVDFRICIELDMYLKNIPFFTGHERLTDDLDFAGNKNNSSFFEPKPLLVPKSCPHQTSIHNELLKEHEMISRLTNSLFALKIGTFRDLMVGSQMISGLGHG